MAVHPPGVGERGVPTPAGGCELVGGVVDATRVVVVVVAGQQRMSADTASSCRCWMSEEGVRQGSGGCWCPWWPRWAVQRPSFESSMPRRPRVMTPAPGGVAAVAISAADVVVVADDDGDESDDRDSLADNAPDLDFAPCDLHARGTGSGGERRKRC